MALQNSLSIRCGDYGHEWTFYLVDTEGQVVPIPTGATLTFEARLSGAETLHVSDSTHVTVVTAASGIVKYAVQSGDWAADDEGDYYCRVVMNHITSSEIPLTALPEQVAPTP